MKLQTNVIGVCTTTKCTLNCRYCVFAIPRFRRDDISYVATIPELKASFEALFDIYEYIGMICLSGGEILMWGDKKISELLLYLEKYKRSFSRIRLVTNGTIVLPNELISIIKQLCYDFEIWIDDYGIHSPKAHAISNILHANEIKYRYAVYHGESQLYGGWMNIAGDLKNKNYSCDELKKIYADCHASKENCLWMMNGKLYPCAQVSLVEIFNGIQDTEHVVPLTDMSIPVEMKISIASRFLKEHPIACNYCNGMNTDKAVRFPAAEQEVR